MLFYHAYNIFPSYKIIPYGKKDVQTDVQVSKRFSEKRLDKPRLSRRFFEKKKTLGHHPDVSLEIPDDSRCPTNLRNRFLASGQWDIETPGFEKKQNSTFFQKKRQHVPCPTCPSEFKKRPKVTARRQANSSFFE